jgi:hypothetical protein
MSDTHEHLEHAEHAQHAAHDPFTAKVAMTMAIIAALLGAVTLLSHRAHTDTLSYQNEANRLFTDADINTTQADINHTKANINHTNAANQWGYYQAKNIRRHNYQTDTELVSFLPLRSDKKVELDVAMKRWQSQLADYEKELPQHKADAEKFMAAADTYNAAADTCNAAADEKQKAAEQQLAESHAAHQKSTFYDAGELAVEIGLVLCSIAVLTKKRGFWFSGIGAAAIGAVIAASAFFITPHAEGHGHAPSTEHHATEKHTGHE